MVLLLMWPTISILVLMDYRSEAEILDKPLVNRYLRTLPLQITLSDLSAISEIISLLSLYSE